MHRLLALAGILLAFALIGPAVAGAQDASPAADAPVYGYRVVDEYPHDPDAFTQGLVYLDGLLYEGTGLLGQSTLREVDLETGQVLRSRPLDPEHFGEGIAVLDDRVYQLTWRTQTCFVYDRATFEPLATFTYPTEGWGLTTDGERLIMSDGTSRLTFRDPATFAEVGAVDVRAGAEPVANLNELEWIDGEIYANVWQSEQIARIDPKTGSVVGWIDLAGILPTGQRTGKEDVLNGIAYDTTTKKLFVTGKWWPTLFEIQLQRR